MSRIRFLIVMGIVALGFVHFTTRVDAEDLRTGEVMVVEKDSVTVEDFDTGKLVKLRLDNKTKIKGTLSKGALVELKEKNGRVVSINVIVEEEPEEETAQETEEKTEGNPEENTEKAD